MRGPFRGVGQVFRFNWPRYAVALASLLIDDSKQRRSEARDLLNTVWKYLSARVEDHPDRLGQTVAQVRRDVRVPFPHNLLPTSRSDK